MKTTTNRPRTNGALPLLLTAAAMMAACVTPASDAPAASAEPAVSAAPAPPPAADPASGATPPPAPPTAPPPVPPAAPAEAASPAGAAASGAVIPPAQEPVRKAAPPRPRVAHLSAGQVLTVRTTRELSTKSMKSGDAFSAILEEPIKADGWIAAAAGTRIDGRIVEADKGGRLKGKASLSVELTSVTLGDGRKVEIVTSPVTSEAAANRRKDTRKVGVGAGAGAAVGAIAGGGSGAAVGALVGAGAGAAMRGEAAAIPAETVIAFELRSPVTIEERR